MNNYKYQTYPSNHQTISFRKTTDKYGFLSNMISNYPLLVNGISIPTSEQLYQALRYPLFPEIQEKIINQSNPMKAKFISKNYTNSLSRQDWLDVRVKIMYWVLHIKFKSYPELSNMLKQTNDLNLVEYSKEDSFWGAERTDNHYVGINMLGRLLMKVRQELNTDIKLPEVNGLLIYNQFIN